MLKIDHPDFNGLMLDIVKNPENDTPKLILADWLDDYGDEYGKIRAKFIRLQIKIAKSSNHNDILEQSDLWNKIRPKERDFAHHVISLDSIFWLTSEYVAWRRGFPDTLHTNVHSWISLRHKIVRRYPLTNVRFLSLRPAQSNYEKYMWYAPSKRMYVVRSSGHLPLTMEHEWKIMKRSTNIESVKVLYYNFEEGALNDLSRATLQVARKAMIRCLSEENKV